MIQGLETESQCLRLLISRNNAVDISLSFLRVFPCTSLPPSSLLPLSLLPLPFPFFISPSLQEKEVHIRQKMSKLRHRVEDKLEHWEEKSKDLIGGFLGMFGRDGRIVSVCVKARWTGCECLCQGKMDGL